MTNTPLATAWKASPREYDGWLIDSRRRSQEEADRQALQLAPAMVARWKIVHEAGYWYVLYKRTEAGNKFMAALEAQD